MNKNINYFKIAKVILFSLFVGLLYNFVSAEGLPLIRQETKLVAASDSVLIADADKKSPDQFVMITTEQAYDLYNSGDAIFIDARDQWDFADGHIPGSINIPEFSFEPDDSTANALDKTARYVVYCHGLDCDVAVRLAKELRKLGFKNLLIYADGWNVWLNSGYAVEKEKVK